MSGLCTCFTIRRHPMLRQAGRQAGRQPLPKPAITMQRTSQLEVVLDAGKDFGAKVLVLSRSNLAAGAVL